MPQQDRLFELPHPGQTSRISYSSPTASTPDAAPHSQPNQERATWPLKVSPMLYRRYEEIPDSIAIKSVVRQKVIAKIETRMQREFPDLGRSEERRVGKECRS